MKGPKILPVATRQALYRDLNQKPLVFSEKELSLIIQNGRVDARLAEVVTEHLRDYWWKYDPCELNHRLRRQPWAAAVKPMLFQILEYCEANPEVKNQFRRWVSEVLRGIANAPPQLYFYDLLPPRSRSQDRELSECLESYRKAGYVAKDLLFNKGQAKKIQIRPREANAKVSTADLMKLDLAGEIIEQIRDLSLVQVGDKYGIDRTTVSKIRSGKLVSFTADRLARILDQVSGTAGGSR